MMRRTALSRLVACVMSVCYVLSVFFDLPITSHQLMDTLKCTALYKSKHRRWSFHVPLQRAQRRQ